MFAKSKLYNESHNKSEKIGRSKQTCSHTEREREREREQDTQIRTWIEKSPEKQPKFVSDCNGTPHIKGQSLRLRNVLF